MTDYIGLTILAVLWILLTALAIFWIIRYRNLSDSARAIWVLVILLVPGIGAITALLATMGNRK